MKIFCVLDDCVGTGDNPAEAFESLQNCAGTSTINECLFYEGIPIEVELVKKEVPVKKTTVK